LQLTFLNWTSTACLSHRSLIRNAENRWTPNDTQGSNGRVAHFSAIATVLCDVELPKHAKFIARPDRQFDRQSQPILKVMDDLLPEFRVVSRTNVSHLLGLMYSVAWRCFQECADLTAFRVSTRVTRFSGRLFLIIAFGNSAGDTVR
jgi:hypothetical protein